MNVWLRRSFVWRIVEKIGVEVVVRFGQKVRCSRDVLG